MPLSEKAALSKDLDTYAPMQHRHLATIANGLRRVREDIRLEVASHMASYLSGTNPKFDKRRFLAACGYEADTLAVIRMIDRAAQ